ncbi:MAG TPA: hypothetical protein VFG14_12885, partial [Chthoniobacteraceae bacterium]|nr:hypothetical protein [Chthoniobacteraceae bacterium]
MELTDPAHEFATLCRDLRGQAPESGATFLAAQFETDEYSEEFYQILFAIVERGKNLSKLTAQIPEATHIAAQIERNISHILVAFDPSYLGSAWKNHGPPKLQEDNVAPIFIFSAVVRNHVSYPLLNDAE